MNDPFALCDGQHIFTCDDLLNVEQLPRSLAVVGAGVIGLEYACIFAALGVRVTLIDSQPQLLPFVDREIIEALVYHLRDNRATLHLGETVSSIETFQDERGEHVRMHLAQRQADRDRQGALQRRPPRRDRQARPRSGRVAGRRARPAAGQRATIRPACRTSTRSATSSAFPSLASTSMEQGRLAACHAFGVTTNSVPELFPYGIYTVPGISMVGRTEEQLTKEGVPYEVGPAHYREIARGQILGDRTGLLKLIFHPREPAAARRAHHRRRGGGAGAHRPGGPRLGGRIDYFVDTVFNYPTLAECYKTAAFDGINRLGLG